MPQRPLYRPECYGRTPFRSRYFYVSHWPAAKGCFKAKITVCRLEWSGTDSCLDKCMVRRPRYVMRTFLIIPACMVSLWWAFLILLTRMVLTILFCVPKLLVLQYFRRHAKNDALNLKMTVGVLMYVLFPFLCGRDGHTDACLLLAVP